MRGKAQSIGNYPDNPPADDINIDPNMPLDQSMKLDNLDNGSINIKKNSGSRSS